MAKYETLNVSPRSKATITRLASKHDLSLVKFVEDMANYFDKTGVNPKDMTILSPAEELKKFRDTIISFMRKQEKDFILPVFSRVDTLAARLIQYIDEEAPKRDNQGKPSLNKTFVLNAVQEGKKEDKSTAEPIPQYPQLKELENLKNEHQKLQEKYTAATFYLKNILDNTRHEKTGVERMPVIFLPMADINDYKAFVKKNV